MNNGPYGAGVACQNASTLSTTGSTSRFPGPVVYGSNPCSGNVPYAMYRYASRENTGGENNIGIVQHTAAINTGRAPTRPASTCRPSSTQAHTTSANPV
jgi:hypothetical protein